MRAAQTIRRAIETDLPVIEEIITAAYGVYLPRMDRPPAPMLRDYAPAVADGTVWVAGTPVVGLDFAEQRARQLQLPMLALYTNAVMTENQAIYAHLGYRETARRSEDGYQRVFMQKELLPA